MDLSMASGLSRDVHCGDGDGRAVWGIFLRPCYEGRVIIHLDLDIHALETPGHSISSRSLLLSCLWYPSLRSHSFIRVNKGKEVYYARSSR